jgi:hypothetical protein
MGSRDYLISLRQDFNKKSRERQRSKKESIDGGYKVKFE